MPLRSYLAEHEVITAFEAGWSQLSNGELLAKAEVEFDLLITTDQQLRYQQNLADRKISIAVLPSASWPKLERHGSKIAAAVAAMPPGGYLELRLD